MPKYRHKTHALQSAIKVWVCKSCGQPHEKVKPADCSHCGFNKFHYFASRFEAKRFAELCVLEKAGLISGLETQVSYELRVGFDDVLICTYIADFVYDEPNTGALVVEDTKGHKAAVTDVFKLKAKLMKAIHGIEIKMVYQSARKSR